MKKVKAFCYVVAWLALVNFDPGVNLLNAEGQRNVEWTGRGQRRILVRIAPYDLHGRKSDRMPARLILAEPLDAGSIQIVRYKPEDGKAISGDVPFRFDLEVNPPDAFAHYWPSDGGKGGTLTWTHEQHEDRPSYYAIYYDPWNPSKHSSFAPRPLIGDGDVLYMPRGPFPSVGRVWPCGFDWDGDGRVDVIVGDEMGYVSWYRNVGTLHEPRFEYSEPIVVDGHPLKVTWSAAPFVTDWNGDGLPDLLVSQEPKGIVHYYQNIGTRKKPRLTDKGLVQADGQVLEPPFLPVPEDPAGVFKDAYGAVPDVVDWNGDGKPDLLLGSYLTGEIYLYENVGTNMDGTPKLHFKGALQADGKDLDVGWNASPSAADLEGDGKLALVSGSLVLNAVTGGEGRDLDYLSRLHYYKQTGSTLHELPFPYEKESLPGDLYVTAIADLNGDGLLDVLAGNGTGQIFYLQNVGTKNKPLFRNQGELEASWVLQPLLRPLISDGGASVVDFYGDAQPALLSASGLEVDLATNAPRFDRHIEIRTAAGTPIGKRATQGDEYGYAQLYDFDNDGKPDLIYGAVDGSVYLYRNIGSREAPRFAEAEQFLLENGRPLIAGIAPDTKITDFDVLQGNRAIPAAADFNGDGKTDLIIGNAFGQVLYFENIGDNRQPRFAPGKEILKRSGRAWVVTTDWDGDGLPDLIISSGGEPGRQIYIHRHVPDPRKAEFLPGQPLPTAYIDFPKPSVFDFNGDGDKDIFVATYNSASLFERSFLEHGYAKVEEIGHETKPGAASANSPAPRKEP